MCRLCEFSHFLNGFNKFENKIFLEKFPKFPFFHSTLNNHMINNFLKINKLFNRSEDKFLISGLNEVLQSYSFIHISKETTLSEDEKQKNF